MTMEALQAADVFAANRTHSYEAVWMCERCERTVRQPRRPAGWQRGVIGCVCDECLKKSKRAARIRARRAA